MSSTSAPQAESGSATVKVTAGFGTPPAPWRRLTPSPTAFLPPHRNQSKGTKPDSLKKTYLWQETFIPPRVYLKIKGNHRGLLISAKVSKLQIAGKIPTVVI